MEKTGNFISDIKGKDVKEKSEGYLYMMCHKAEIGIYGLVFNQVDYLRKKYYDEEMFNVENELKKLYNRLEKKYKILQMSEIDNKVREEAISIMEDIKFEIVEEKSLVRINVKVGSKSNTDVYTKKDRYAEGWLNFPKGLDEMSFILRDKIAGFPADRWAFSIMDRDKDTGIAIFPKSDGSGTKGSCNVHIMIKLGNKLVMDDFSKYCDDCECISKGVNA